VAIPLLEYAPTSLNVRVAGYEVPGDDQPFVFDAEALPSGSDMDALIWAAYRQVYSEHQILKSNRQTYLESQLRDGRISVRDFIRGLATSDPFLRRNFSTNSNYRFVEMCIQRLLGRDLYNKREAIAWSIVIVNEGVTGFIDALLNTDEYVNNFGDSVVPYQRRRNLPQRAAGETPFNLKTPRYDAYHRGQLGFPQIIWQNQVRRFKPQEQKAKNGSPENFLSMARSIAATPTASGNTAVGSMNYLALVPNKNK